MVELQGFINVQLQVLRLPRMFKHYQNTRTTDNLSVFRSAPMLGISESTFKILWDNEYCIYTIILLKYVCLSLFANCRSQFLLDRLGRYLKLFVSTVIPSSHELASQFGPSTFVLAKNTQNYRKNCECSVDRTSETARTQTAVTAVKVDRQQPVRTVTT